MFKTFKEAWRLAETRKKILFTIFAIIIFRLGNIIPVPFIDKQALAQIVQRQGNSGAISLLNLLSGGSLQQMSIFAQSVYPYITASIIIQLLTIAFPTLGEIAKEGEEGKQKIAFYTKLAGVAIAFVQAWAIVKGLYANAIVAGSTYEQFLILLSIVTGTMFLVWLGELITQKGIGNGISILILLGIVSNLPRQIGVIWRDASLGTLSMVGIFLLGLIVVGTLIIVIMINQGERKIPVQYAKRVVGRKMYGGQATHIPVKVNMAGVMPVIFSGAIVSLPSTLGLFFGREMPKWYQNIFSYQTLSGMIIYLIVNITLIILFAYFYTAVQFNTVEYAKNLQQSGGFIPGIRPGKPTGTYLQRISTRITFIGAVALAIVANLPVLVGYSFGIRMLFGGTSVIIVVGVILDTLQQLESMLTMRHYRGFLK